MPCVVAAAALSVHPPVLLALLPGRARVLWGAGSEVLFRDRWHSMVGALSLSRDRGRHLSASPTLDFQFSFVRGEFVKFLSF